ncbi:MAG: PqqD family protein, partial [Thermoplasmata archaeon]
KNSGIVYEILPPTLPPASSDGRGRGGEGAAPPPQRPPPPPSQYPTKPRSPGTVSILVPRFRGRVGRGFCRLIGVGENIRVNLDSYGTFVWLSIDGRTSVRELGKALREEFGSGVEPVYARLAAFLSLLERNGLIHYAAGEKELIPKRHASREPR